MDPCTKYVVKVQASEDYQVDRHQIVWNRNIGADRSSFPIIYIQGRREDFKAVSLEVHHKVAFCENTVLLHFFLHFFSKNKWSIFFSGWLHSPLYVKAVSEGGFHFSNYLKIISLQRNLKSTSRHCWFKMKVSVAGAEDQEGHRSRERTEEQEGGRRRGFGGDGEERRTGGVLCRWRRLWLRWGWRAYCSRVRNFFQGRERGWWERESEESGSAGLGWRLQSLPEGRGLTSCNLSIYWNVPSRRSSRKSSQK